MPPARTAVPVRFWKRFITYNFQIVPSLAGMAHKFIHKKHEVEIKLPEKPHRKNWSDNDAKIYCRHWRTKGGRDYPVSFVVNSVDLTIETGKIRKISPKSIGVVNHSLFNKNQRNTLDRLTHEYEQIADQAFERWLNILRWKTNILDLCSYYDSLERSSWGPYLFDASSNKPFYTPPYTMTVRGLRSIKKKNWRLTQTALNENIDTPIWHLYIAEAHQKRIAEDTKGFLLDLAISIETIVRFVIDTYITDEAPVAFGEAVGRMPIMPLLDNWNKINSKNSRWNYLKNDINRIKELFVKRNRVMHRGAALVMTKSEMNEIERSASIFIRECESQIKKS